VFSLSSQYFLTRFSLVNLVSKTGIYGYIIWPSETTWFHAKAAVCQLKTDAAKTKSGAPKAACRAEVAWGCTTCTASLCSFWYITLIHHNQKSNEDYDKNALLDSRYVVVSHSEETNIVSEMDDPNFTLWNHCVAQIRYKRGNLEASFLTIDFWWQLLH